jgi:HlyD family secretion protein
MGMDRVIKKRKRPLGWILGSAAVACLAAVFGWQLLAVDKSAVQTVKKEDLRISTVMKGVFLESFHVNGYIAPEKSIYIDSQENGVVQSVNVEKGSIVEKGKVLLTLKNTELESQLLLEQAGIRSAQKDLEDNALRMRQLEIRNSANLLEIDNDIDLAGDDYEAKKTQFTVNAIPEKTLQRAKKELDHLRQKRELLLQSNRIDLDLLEQEGKKIESSIDVLKINLDRIRRRAETLTVTSPAYGQVTVFDASVGEMKAAGSHIAQLDIMNTLKLKADLDEYYISKIEVGSGGYFTFPNSQGEGICRFVVSWISPNVKNNSFEVEFKFTSKPPALRVGQRFLLRIELGERKEAVMLEQGQYYQSGGKGWVFVVDPSGRTATKREIVIGRTSPEYIEVREGLSPGENVVISDYSDFTNAEKITLR